MKRSLNQRMKRLARATRERDEHPWLARAWPVIKLFALMSAVYLFLVWLTSENAPSLVRHATPGRLALVLLAASVATLLHRGWRNRVRKVFRRQRFRESYDERSILSDLSLAARGVTTREQLFKLFVSRIQEALKPASVAIFVRDDASGDYHCEIISELAPAKNSGAAGAACYEACDLVLSRDAFVVRRLTKLAIPLTVSADDYQSWMRALAAASPARREARRRESETLARIQAALLVPIMMKDEEVGIISLGAREGRQPYSEESKQLLFSIAGQMAFVIENTKLAERIVEEERLRREIAMATEVQRRLFPGAAPARRALDLAGSCHPARGVGGDYYDFLELDEYQTGVAVADVAGKGISAALLMSIVQASLRSQVASAKEGSLAELVSNMNQLMRRSTGAASFATFFYAQFDDRTGNLTYVNAGHNPPLLWRAERSKQDAAGELEAGQEVARAMAVGAMKGGSVAVLGGANTGLSAPEKLTTGGPVIGVLSDCVYEQAIIHLQRDDLLLAYTDGITEAMNFAEEEFGEERLEQVLSEGAHLSAEELRAEIVRRVREWSNGVPQHDDLTVVVMKVK